MPAGLCCIQCNFGACHILSPIHALTPGEAPVSPMIPQFCSCYSLSPFQAWSATTRLLRPVPEILLVWVQVDQLHKLEFSTGQGKDLQSAPYLHRMLQGPAGPAILYELGWVASMRGKGFWTNWNSHFGGIQFNICVIGHFPRMSNSHSGLKQRGFFFQN